MQSLPKTKNWISKFGAIAVICCLFRAVSQYPADDSGKALHRVFIPIDNSHNTKLPDHVWKEIIVDLEKGEKIKSAVDMYFEGLLEKGPMSLEEAYSGLKSLNPESAEKVNASMEHEGFFIFSIADSEKAKSKGPYWKFSLIRKGGRTFCAYDEERY
jgi:hypothetical protein